MEPKYVIALEISSSKIRGAAGTVDDAGILTVVALDEEPLIDCVRYGCIRNVEEVASRISRIVKKLENRLHPRRVRHVYVSLGGMTFSALERDVTRRLPEEEEVTEGLLADLRSQAFELPTGGREVIDVVERRVFIDRNQTPQPVGSYGQDIKAEYNLITCRSKTRQMIQRVVNDRLRLGIAGYVVRQLAEADLVLSSDEKKLGCVLVDFGAETTAVSIYKNGYLNYFATLPLGSRNITLDISQALNLLEERAEELKKKGGNAAADRQPQRYTSESVNYDDVNNYVSARSGEIIANINEQIKYADLSPAKLPAGIVVVGGGAKLAGFCDRLSQETKMTVRVGVPTSYIRLLEGRIQGSEAVDVISVLYAAARAGAKECMELPATEVPAPATVTDAATTTAAGATATGAAATEAASTDGQHREQQRISKAASYEPDDTPIEDVPEKPRSLGWRKKFSSMLNKFLTDDPDEEEDF